MFHFHYVPFLYTFSIHYFIRILHLDEVVVLDDEVIALDDEVIALDSSDDSSSDDSILDEIFISNRHNFHRRIAPVENNTAISRLTLN